MIQCFFQDVNLLWNSFSKPPMNHVEENKVILAAIRVVSSIFMASGTLKVISALPTLASSNGIVNIATGVAKYVIGHDVFVMARNITELHNVQEAAETGVTAIFNGIIKWKKDAGAEEAAKKITQGTFLPVWQASQVIWFEPVTRFFLTRK